MKQLFGIFFLLILTSAYTESLTFNRSTHDFGNINGTDKVSTNFEFVNQTDQPQTIDKIKTTCGCTAGELTKKTYLPNESGSLKITFNPQGKHGNQIKNISVFLVDLPTPIKLQIKAHILTEWEIKPEFIRFRYNNINEPLTVQFQSISELKPAIFIKEIHGIDPEFIQKNIDNDESSYIENYTISITPNDHQFQTTLQVVPSNEKFQPKKIQIFGQLQEPLIFLPKKIKLTDQKNTQTISIRSMDGIAIEITKISCSIPGFSYENKSNNHPHFHQILISVPKGQIFKNTSVKIYTTHPKLKILNIPISYHTYS